MDLLAKKCIPCEGGTPPLSLEEAEGYLAQVPGWELEGEKKIKKSWKFKDFKEAMVFVNNVANIAESEGHHPDISISYNKVNTELTTHAIGGLSENDFIMASKINQIK